MENLLDFLPVGLIVLKGQEPYDILRVNDILKQMSGCDMDRLNEWKAELWVRLGEQEQALVKTSFSEAKRKGCSDEYEICIKNKKRGERWYAFRVRKAEEASLFLMTVEDIHERKLMEEELHIQTERYKMVEQITGELPFDMDVESGEVLISGKYLAIRGMRDTLEHYAKMEELESIIYKPDVIRFRRAMEEAKEQEIKSSLELRLKVSNSSFPEEYCWYRLIYMSVSGVNDKIVRIVGRFMDINEEKLEHSELSEQVKRDTLTGLLNKNAAKEEMEEYLMIASGGRHAFLMIGIDNFTHVNDAFGPLFADTVLINIAERIEGIFRKNDIVSRAGGDIFLVMMKGAAPENAIEKVERLCEELRQSYQGRNQEVKVSCSVGVAFYDRNGKSVDELYEKAELAMYQAKEAGKDQYKIAETGNQVAAFRQTADSARQTAAKQAAEKKDYGVVRIQDEGFLSAAFSLLAHAKDVNSSLNLLLERIGKRYELDMVAVLEDIGDGEKFIQTNCWWRNSRIVTEPVYADWYEQWKPFMEDFDDRGILCIHSQKEPDSGEGPETLEKPFADHALVNCRFQCQDQTMYMLLFGSQQEERVWSDFEKETFLEISRIVSVFVSLRKNQQESEDKIQDLKNRDSLTGLYNEATFKKLVQEKIRKLDPKMAYAIVFSDIRDFSYVNENFGIEAGNQILREYADIITFTPDQISTRIHSDLFASLVWDVSKEKIKQEVERTVKDFTKEQRRKFPQGNVRMVAGLYFIEKDNEDVNTVQENANLIRKKIKQNAGASVCQVYTEELRQEREAETKIASEFEEALEGEEFSVYIQPKFFLHSMEISGGEALVRWIKPDGSMVFPDQFIPVLERTGYIVQLDFYMFEHVLQNMQKWKTKGKQLYQISVNFSRKHFEGKGIYQKVCELTDKYGIDHQFVEIEITESLLVAGLDMVKAEMELLRKDGFSVAIDDFGTGYSSLSMLHDIPADIVKIDKSFLDKSDMEEERDFIEKIGALIRSVKEEIIFEGVETQQQVEFLLDCGFRYGQGYLCDRPLPVSVFEEKYMK